MIAYSSGNTHLLKATSIFFAGLLCGFLATPIAWAQTQASTPQVTTSQMQPVTIQSGRKAKSNPPPDYPELARKLNIQGMARVLLTVTADGKVAGVKDLGGNPILVTALSDAAKKWKYEPADRESQVEVRYEFVQKN